MSLYMVNKKQNTAKQRDINEIWKRQLLDEVGCTVRGRDGTLKRTQCRKNKSNGCCPTRELVHYEQETKWHKTTGQRRGNADRNEFSACSVRIPSYLPHCFALFCFYRSINLHGVLVSEMR